MSKGEREREVCYSEVDRDGEGRERGKEGRQREVIRVKGSVLIKGGVVGKGKGCLEGGLVGK